MYCMDVEVISQSAGGKNMKGLNDLSCEDSFSSETIDHTNSDNFLSEIQICAVCDSSSANKCLCD